MTDLKSKMHQIRFPLGLCPRPRWGDYSAPSWPTLLGVFNIRSLLRRRGKGERGRNGNDRRERSEKGRGERGKGMKGRNDGRMEGPEKSVKPR